ncbi:MAG: cytochrome C oxidase subunit IV family protein [Anaerolineales bacterium]|jgi:cytochrome c oxidase subunit 4
METSIKTPQESQARPQPNYLGVFIALAVLTLLELGITYMDLPRIPLLVPLAVIKAALVALFYMHLRYDRKIFSVLFIFGVIMGIGLIFSFILLFQPQLLDMH